MQKSCEARLLPLYCGENGLVARSGHPHDVFWTNLAVVWVTSAHERDSEAAVLSQTVPCVTAYTSSASTDASGNRRLVASS